jgi:hypothetical protein
MLAGYTRTRSFLPLPQRLLPAQTGLVSKSSSIQQVQQHKENVMSTISVTVVVVLILAIGVGLGQHAGPAPLRRWLRRGAGMLRAGTRAQIELQERFLRTQRPWQADWLRWVRTADGWRLSGTVIPPELRRGQLAPRQRPSHGNRNGTIVG